MPVGFEKNEPITTKKALPTNLTITSSSFQLRLPVEQDVAVAHDTPQSTESLQFNMVCCNYRSQKRKKKVLI